MLVVGGQVPGQIRLSQIGTRGEAQPLSEERLGHGHMSNELRIACSIIRTPNLGCTQSDEADGFPVRAKLGRVYDDEGEHCSA